MMDDQTYANMMKRSQWNFAQKKKIFPLWEYLMKPIKNKKTEDSIQFVPNSYCM